jgi:hypothetical protein
MAGIETGECPPCRYLGWTDSDGIDKSTRGLIMNGGFARRRARIVPLGPA